MGQQTVYGINAYVRVGRYAYVHVDASPGIQVESVVKAYETVIGKTNSWNHIHFKDGNPGQEINALRNSGGFSPFNDPYPPAIDAVNFYVNGSTTPFTEKRVSGLVEIVVKARDRTDNGPLGDNNGIYGIGYQIFDSTGTTALTEFIQNFVFYQIPPSDAYVTNVYFTGSDLSNYYYTVTNKITADAYWDTRGFLPGKYKVRVFTTDTYLNEAEVWTDVEVVESDITPPDRPALMAFEGDDTKRWQLSWLPNTQSDIAGYKVYFSIRGDIWTLQSALSDQTAADDTTLVYENFNNHFTAYFRLIAYDNAAAINYSDSSDVYGVRLAESGPEVLIVNGFTGRNGYWKQISNPFVINYGQALTKLDISFNSCSAEALVLGRVDLSDYPTVIYFTGDDLGENPALTDQEQPLIRSYLQTGGSLILCGSEIGADLFLQGSPDDSVFYTNYLKATTLSDSSGSLNILGADGSLLSGFNGQLRAEVRPDLLSPAGSEVILRYGNGGSAGIFYQGIFPGGSADAQLVYLAFPIDQLVGAEAQNALIEDIMNLLGVVDYIAKSEKATIPTDRILKRNFPNPFNPQTTLEFELQKSANIRLTIFSIDGRAVRTVHSGRLPAGTHRFIWSGDDDLGRVVSSGIYIYRLQSEGLTQSRKMVLLR